MSPQQPEITSWYSNYVLGLLLSANILNFIDRSVIGILLEDIKDDFYLSDAQLGFLDGYAFALLYGLMSIPIARCADHASRQSIICGSILFWSLFSALTGSARSYWMIVVARVGAGIGEAGCSPSAQSLIFDFFPPGQRTRALAIYWLGIPIGGSLATVGGAWVSSLFGWRMAFWATGLPGILLVLIIWMTLREPDRGHYEAVAPLQTDAMPFGELLRFLAGLRSYLHVVLALSINSISSGTSTFTPSFFHRVHKLELTEVGMWLSGLQLLSVVGTCLGGWLGDCLATRDVRWYVWIPAIAWGTATLLYVGFFLVPNPYLAFLLFGVPIYIIMATVLPPLYTLTQMLVLPHMRATTFAICLSILHLFRGFGPLLVGYISDSLAVQYGVESLRWALLSCLSIVGPWSVFHLVFAARTLESDLIIKDTWNSLSATEFTQCGQDPEPGGG